MRWLHSFPLRVRSALLQGECRIPCPDSRYARSNSIRRFVDDALGFALTWNYWFNDAVSTASDIIALQLLLEFWTDNFPGWAISLIFLVVVIALNLLSVKVYGEVGAIYHFLVCGVAWLIA